MSTLGDFFDAFDRTIIEAKECLVRMEGLTTDLPPTFCVMSKETHLSVMGRCNNAIHRHVPVTSDSTKWMNLIRQVVTLTRADVAFAAVEVMVEDALEGIEVSAIDAEDSITVVHPYTYDVGRKVIWGETREPHPHLLMRGTCFEMNAARRAWLNPGEVAYPISVRLLSEQCDTHWTGSPELLASLASVN